MRLSIAERLAPFSHLPGTTCLLPRSFLRCVIFPTRLVVEDISKGDPKRLLTLDFSLKAPVKDFTIQQDLEKGIIRVFGHYNEGFVRYCLAAKTGEASFTIKVERCPENGLKWIDCSNLNKTVQSKEEISFTAPCASSPPPFRNQRLSLGSHKNQDFDLIRRRADLLEILPLWHSLGRQFENQNYSSLDGSFELLESCRQVINQKNKLEVYPAFLSLFQAGFEGILSPRLYDEQHQGFLSKYMNNCQKVPLALLIEGSKLISKLFIDRIDEEIVLLPCLSPEFHSGRMLGVFWDDLGEIGFEWSKKLLRRVIFKSKKDGPIYFAFQKELKAFRVRTAEKIASRGAFIKVGEPLICQAGMTYFLDNFTK